MNSGSRWPHIIRAVIVFIVGGVVLGVIQYYAERGSHHHKTTLLFSVVVGAIAGLVTYFRSRSDRAARGLGRQLRAKIDAQHGEGTPPIQQQPETQSVSETGPRHPG